MKIEIDSPLIYRFRSDSNFTLDELENSYVYFQNPKKLNDPFECCYYLMYVTRNPIELKKLYRLIAPKLRYDDNENIKKDFAKNIFWRFSVFVDERIKVFIENFGIACFTNNPQNHLMWSHYANFHRGVCLQYDISKDSKFFHGIRPINYIRNIEPKEYWPISRNQDILHLLYTKSDLWEEEQELRVVSKMQGQIPVEKNSLRSIIFGINTSDEFKKKVINITRDKYPDLSYFNSKPSEQRFGISLTKL